MPKHAQESSLLLAGLELQSERTPVDIASFTIILSHLNLLVPGDGPRAPPNEARSWTASPTTRGPRDLIYEPVHDDLLWPDPA